MKSVAIDADCGNDGGFSTTEHTETPQDTERRGMESKQMQKLLEKRLQFEKFTAASGGVGNDVRIFRNDRGDVRRPAYLAAGAVAERSAAVRTPLLKKLAAVRTPVTSMRRGGLAVWTEKQSSRDDIRNVRGTMAVRTESMQNLRIEDRRGHGLDGIAILGFRRFKRNAEIVRYLLDGVVGNLRGHPAFEHRNGRLPAANGLCKGSLVKTP